MRCKLTNKKTTSINKLKNDILSNISHELRTPMHAILSFSKFGIDKIDRVSKEKIITYFSNIHDCANQLMSFLENLLNITNLESGKTNFNFTTESLSQIFRQLIIEFELDMDSKDLKFAFKEDINDATIVLDRARISQLIQNLISNAILYSKDKSTIVIEFENSSLVLDGKKTPAIQSKIIFKDIGVPKSEVNRIFENDSETSEFNLGFGSNSLGLAICKLIVNAHRGSITALKSEDLPGYTTFTFSIPRHRAVT